MPDRSTQAAGGAVAVLAADDPRYAAFQARHPFGGLFSSPPWLASLAEGYGIVVEIAAVMEGDRVRAAMPFSHLKDLRGERLIALPFSDFCDPLAESPADWQALADFLLARGAGLRLRCLDNPLPLADSRLEPHGDALWHGVDLAREEEAIFASLGGSARRNIRKAEKLGVTVRAGTDVEDALLFHRMHASLRKSKYRMLAQPPRFFTALHANFAPLDGIAVLVAELDGEPLAGIFCLTWGDTLYYKFNASFDTAARPNDLLAWSALRHGRARGLARFDFGLSDADQPGLVRYKCKFATEEKPVHMLRRPPERAPDPAQEEAGRLLGRLTELLTDEGVPDHITREAGDALYRYFA